MLLSLVNANAFSVQECAAALGMSVAHCRALARQLATHDVAQALFDKRVGQQRDYRVGPEQKAEIIQQWAARTVTGQSTSSGVLAQQVDAMRKRLEEFEYIRHGTLDVLAFLHHADGHVFMECQADHKTVDWNTLLAHPFRWTYDGKGLHEKAVRRFTQMLRRPAPQMELRILTKQLLLVTNLLRGYVSQVSLETWAEFATVLDSQHDAIAEHIQAEPGPKRKLNAQHALAALRDALDEFFHPSQPTAE